MSTKRDCFAYKEVIQNGKCISRNCICLNELYCRTEDECHFYKNKSEVDLDKIKKEVKAYAPYSSLSRKIDKEEGEEINEQGE